MRFKSQKLFLDSESEALKAATSLLRGCALDRYLKKRYNAHSDDEAIEAVPEFLIVGNGCKAFLQVPVKGGGRCQYINAKATKHYKI